jgi:hypothetical protein
MANDWASSGSRSYKQMLKLSGLIRLMPYKGALFRRAAEDVQPVSCAHH